MRRNIVLALVALLIVGGIASWKYQWPHWLWDQNTTATADVADPGKLCLQKQQEELVRWKAARLAYMHGQIQAKVQDHLITADQAQEYFAYVDAHPNGDAAIGRDGIVRWTLTLKGAAAPLHLTYHLLCVCTQSATVETPPPPCATYILWLPPTRHMALPSGYHRKVRYAMMRHAPIESFNCWGIIVGQYRMGSPRNCDSCVWTNDPLVQTRRYFVKRGDNRKVRYYHTSVYEVPDDATSGRADGWVMVTIVVPLETVYEGFAPCIEVDGHIFASATTLPFYWNGFTATLPADYWLHPRRIEHSA